MKYAWIYEHALLYSVVLMCGVLNVNRSAYYRWIRLDMPSPIKRDSELEALVKAEFDASRQTYGTRRMKAVLKAQHGVIVSRRRLRTIMKILRLNAKAKKRFKVLTTDSNHNYPTAPNRLDRNFTVEQPDRVYVGDITYIPTREGWLYLATVIDLFSRKIVGWAMDSTMTTALVNKALMMAVIQRNPLRGLIWHTDRGSQYAAYDHKDLLNRYGIIQSMSKKGDCWDNAVAESFFHSLKTELTHHILFETRRDAHVMIFEYIEVFYNKRRLHSSNNYLSPEQFEKKMLQMETAA